MKALKRILCIVLSMAMILGMAVVAHAADESKYQEAVTVLKALKIMVGDTAGDLDLEGTLTREQAAKLVTYLMLGSYKAGYLTAKNTFRDVPADNWAASYISYCYDQKIINGFDDHLFHPTENVTGYQFGKMLVCCIGYDMEKEEISGPYWDARISALMYANGLMDGLDIDLGKAITREEAAQLCFNALKATVLKYQEEGGLFPVDNYAVVETIYNDNKLQLGEKLYPALRRIELKDNYIWKYGAKTIAKYPLPEKEEEDLSEYHALFGFKKLLLNERVLNTLGVFNKAPGASPLGRTAPKIADYLKAVAAEAEENTVLFSKELIGVYSPVLFAKAGEEIFVKANWISEERLENLANGTAYVLGKIFDRKLGVLHGPADYEYDLKANHIPTKLKSTTSTEVEYEDIIDANFAAALFEKYVNGNDNFDNVFLEPLGTKTSGVAADTREKNHVLEQTFGKDALKFADELARLGLMTALKENGLEGIDLEMVTPAIGDIPAVYKFVMPDRMVTGWDFKGVETYQVKFVMPHRTFDSSANEKLVWNGSQDWKATTKHGAALLVVQTGEFAAPQIKLVATGIPTTVSVSEGEVIRFSIVPLLKMTSNYYIPYVKNANGSQFNLAKAVESHELAEFIGDIFKQNVSHDDTHAESYAQYTLFNIGEDITVQLVGNGYVKSWSDGSRWFTDKD